MRLAIADPPYLGRAQRWYGVGGRASGGGLHRADEHPDAAEWDDPARHQQLVMDLVDRYEGWAVAAAPTSIATYLAVVPPGTRMLVWHKPNAVPSAHRVRWSYEPVFVFTPPGRRQHDDGLSMQDVLVAPVQRGFAGAKPPSWTRWVLDAMGFHPRADTVDDLFPGSGAVSAVIAQEVLL